MPRPHLLEFRQRAVEPMRKVIEMLCDSDAREGRKINSFITSIERQQHTED